MRPPDALREAVRERVASPAPDAGAREAAQAVEERGGDSTRAIVFFGSRKTQARPDAWSAYDFFVVVDRYRPFYDTLRAHGALRRPSALVAALNRPLPPNQIGLTLGAAGEGTGRAKCAVVSAAAFARETSPARRDHFFLGRLCQQTEVVFAADEASREAVVDALASAHALTYTWVRPWLPERFDVGTFCRTFLRVSYSAEIRPEPDGRADALWEAQRGYLAPVYGVLLHELHAAGELVLHEPGTYGLARPAASGERLRLSAYFWRSKIRATLRWAKYVVTFDDWLEFILRKATRHSGQAFVLTPRERRFPLVFLWPRVFRYLRHKDR
ncbi:MAG: hypothetical protein ABW221_04355 [Vicinamibacteria bacterium]